MKIVNLNKFVRGICLIFVITLLIILFASKGSFSYSEKTYKTIYVCSGDTLWSIATNLQNTEYYAGKDVRFIINDIKKINGLTNSNLLIGEEITIPIL